MLHQTPPDKDAETKLESQTEISAAPSVASASKEMMGSEKQSAGKNAKANVKKREAKKKKKAAATGDEKGTSKAVVTTSSAKAQVRMKILAEQHMVDELQEELNLHIDLVKDAIMQEANMRLKNATPAMLGEDGKAREIPLADYLKHVENNEEKALQHFEKTFKSLLKLRSPQEPLSTPGHRGYFEDPRRLLFETLFQFLPPYKNDNLALKVVRIIFNNLKEIANDQELLECCLGAATANLNVRLIQMLNDEYKVDFRTPTQRMPCNVKVEMVSPLTIQWLSAASGAPNYGKNRDKLIAKTNFIENFTQTLDALIKYGVDINYRLMPEHLRSAVSSVKDHKAVEQPQHTKKEISQLSPAQLAIRNPAPALFSAEFKLAPHIFGCIISFDIGATLLMAACQGGDEDAARLLIDRKADIDARTINGSTALVYAVEGNHKNIVGLLLKEEKQTLPGVPTQRGANPLIKTSHGESPLKLALQRQDDEIIGSLTSAIIRRFFHEHLDNTDYIYSQANKDLINQLAKLIKKNYRKPVAKFIDDSEENEARAHQMLDAWLKLPEAKKSTPKVFIEGNLLAVKIQAPALGEAKVIALPTLATERKAEPVVSVAKTAIATKESVTYIPIASAVSVSPQPATSTSKWDKLAEKKRGLSSPEIHQHLDTLDVLRLKALKITAETPIEIVTVIQRGQQYKFARLMRLITQLPESTLYNPERPLGAARYCSNGAFHDRDPASPFWIDIRNMRAGYRSAHRKFLAIYDAVSAYIEASYITSLKDREIARARINDAKPEDLRRLERGSAYQETSQDRVDIFVLSLQELLSYNALLTGAVKHDLSDEMIANALHFTASQLAMALNVTRRVNGQWLSDDELSAEVLKCFNLLLTFVNPEIVAKLEANQILPRLRSLNFSQFLNDEASSRHPARPTQATFDEQKKSIIVSVPQSSLDQVMMRRATTGTFLPAARARDAQASRALIALTGKRGIAGSAASAATSVAEVYLSPASDDVAKESALAVSAKR